MNEVSEGLDAETDTSSQNLLDAFIAEGDLGDVASLADEEAPRDDTADVVTDADQPETDDETDEDTETVEAKDADDADAEDEDGDFVEFETEDGATERVAVSDLLESHKQLTELGSNADEIRSQIAEQATVQVQERTTALDNQIQQTVELYGLLDALMPKLEQPSQELLNPQSPHYNPDAYREQMNAVQEVQSVMDGAKAKMTKLKEQYQKEAVQRQKLQAQSDWAKLTAKDKTWLQPGAEKRLDDVRTAASKLYGIDTKLISSITHPGFIQMAEDAKLYREAKAKPAPKTKKGAPRLVKGGSKRKAADPSASRRAKANDALRKTGRVTDLEGVWGEFLE